MNEIQRAKYEVWMWRRIFKRVVIPLVVFLLIVASISFIYALRTHRIIHGNMVESKLVKNSLVENEIEGDGVTDSLPERVVFLTFDDGPSWNTTRILDLLYTEDVPSIFFLIGDHIINHPESEALMERMLAEGHYIGLHSMTHEFDTLYEGEGASDRFVAEMLQLQNIIYESVGHYSDLCRAPFGMMTGFRPDSGHAEATREAGINCIDWNVDPKDWRSSASAQLVLEYVIKQVEMLDSPSELVIVLHEQEATIEALPSIISFLREQGYVFKTYQPGYEFVYTRYSYRLH